MRKQYDLELLSLKNKMSEMYILMEQSIKDTVECIATCNKPMAKEVVLRDKDIDMLNEEIQQLCFRLILTEQPVAQDLRTISSAMKMITDMERIGDHAQDICEIILESPEDGLALDYGHISQMASAVLSMVRDSIHAFVSGDIALCESIGRYDDVVDDLFQKAKIDVIQLIRHDVNYSEKALDLFTIAKYFERIGDHATNIAEWVMFSITGEHPSLQ